MQTTPERASMLSPGATGPRGLAALIGWIALCFLPAAGILLSRPDAWYAALQKPSWNPPNAVFGPVWSGLYLMMGGAAWLVWAQGGFARQRVPLTLFLLQLVLNGVWEPLFFGAHQIAWALVDSALLWAVIALTLLMFSRVSRYAAALLIPYLMWVSFATALNFTLWRLNR